MNPDMSSFASGPPDISLVQVAIYATLGLLLVLFLLTFLAVLTLPIFFVALIVMGLVLKGSSNLPDPIGKYSKIGGLVFRSLRRNLFRTALTYVALFVLTGMLTAIYSFVTNLSDLTKEKEGAQLVILTEKFGIPSQMPPGYFNQLRTLLLQLPRDSIPRPLTDDERRKDGLPLKEGEPVTKADIEKYFTDKPDADFTPEEKTIRNRLVNRSLEENMMSWSFVVGSLDATQITKENQIMFFALQPEAIENGLMSGQGLSKDDLGEKLWNDLLNALEVVKQDKRNVVIGEDKLKLMNKKVGDEIKVAGLNYSGIDFECRIVGMFPTGTRLSGAACLRHDYLMSKLDSYRIQKGEAHPVYGKCLNLVWVRMPSKDSFEKLSGVVNKPGEFSSPMAKIETFSSIIGAFMESFKDILWGMKWIVMPAIVVIMCLVISITITIGVRERWTEMAMMKVLGFQPWQVMGMIVSESVLIGLFGGMLSTWTVFFLPKIIKFICFITKSEENSFSRMTSPWEIIIYGPLLGVGVALIGAALPSWNARKVKVSQVFAQVA
jgi:putative ABC transport system permease protein